MSGRILAIVLAAIVLLTLHDHAQRVGQEWEAHISNRISQAAETPNGWGTEGGLG